MLPSLVSDPFLHLKIWITMQVCVYVTGNLHVSQLTVTFKFLKGQISSTNADRYELVMLSSFVSDPLLYPLKMWITMQVCVCMLLKTFKYLDITATFGYLKFTRCSHSVDGFVQVWWLLCYESSQRLCYLRQQKV